VLSAPVRDFFHCHLRRTSCSATENRSSRRWQYALKYAKLELSGQHESGRQAVGPRVEFVAGGQVDFISTERERTALGALTQTWNKLDIIVEGKRLRLTLNKVPIEVQDPGMPRDCLIALEAAGALDQPTRFRRLDLRLLAKAIK
jgi:hypothetical protein